MVFWKWDTSDECFMLCFATDSSQIKKPQYYIYTKKDWILLSDILSVILGKLLESEYLSNLPYSEFYCT